MIFICKYGTGCVRRCEYGPLCVRPGWRVPPWCKYGTESVRWGRCVVLLRKCGTGYMRSGWYFNFLCGAVCVIALVLLLILAPLCYMS